jgi:hypothetical protein
MSQQTYREVIKPHQENIDAVTAGVIFSQHICGKQRRSRGFRGDGRQDLGSAGVHDLKGSRKNTEAGSLWKAAGISRDPPAISGHRRSGRCRDAPVRAAIRADRKLYFYAILLNEKGNVYMVGDERFPLWSKLA